MKILVADDEEAVRDSLAIMLKKNSQNEIDFAVDGEEAVTKITSANYDLLLLDIEMPKINGYEVLKKVRALYPTLPVVFITARGEPSKVRKSIAQYRLNGYLEKPFDTIAVLDIVKKALGLPG